MWCLLYAYVDTWLTAMGKVGLIWELNCQIFHGLCRWAKLCFFSITTCRYIVIGMFVNYRRRFSPASGTLLGPSLVTIPFLQFKARWFQENPIICSIKSSFLSYAMKVLRFQEVERNSPVIISTATPSTPLTMPYYQDPLNSLDNSCFAADIFNTKFM